MLKPKSEYDDNNNNNNNNDGDDNHDDDGDEYDDDNSGLITLSNLPKIAPHANYQIDNNFPRSILLSTIDITSTCSILK